MGGFLWLTKKRVFFSDDEIYTKNLAPFGCEGLFMTGTRCCQCSWTNSSFDERASAVEAALKAIRSRLGGGYFVGGWKWLVGLRLGSF